jgi:hypothetical protein
MVGLLSLSNELLIHVFSSCTTVESAASLSSVDKTLSSVWRRYNNHIAASVLRQQVPEYADAVDLAILEEIWINGNTQIASTPLTKLPVRLYGKQLLKIAGLAINARAARERRTISPPEYTSLHVVWYYLMRKIALAYQYPDAQLQDVLCQTLRSYSEREGDRIGFFCMFLTWPESDFPEREKHDIGEILAIRRPEYEWLGDVCWKFFLGEPWKYVQRVIRAVGQEERHGRDYLEQQLRTHVDMDRPSNT